MCRICVLLPPSLSLILGFPSPRLSTLNRLYSCNPRICTVKYRRCCCGNTCSKISGTGCSCSCRTLPCRPLGAHFSFECMFHSKCPSGRFQYVLESRRTPGLCRLGNNRRSEPKFGLHWRLFCYILDGRCAGYCPQSFDSRANCAHSQKSSLLAFDWSHQTSDRSQYSWH